MLQETALSRLEQENLQLVFQTNTFGPILVCKVRSYVYLIAWLPALHLFSSLLFYLPV